MEKDERQLLIEVSVMYYLEGKTQSEIAKALYLSRPKVSRLLKRARELDIVDIKINYESDGINGLQNELKRRFQLDNVVVVKTLSNYDDTMKEIGKASATVLIQEIKAGMTVGISWGRSVRSAVTYLPQKPIKDVKIVELFGAISYDMDNDMLSIGNELTQKIGARFFPLPAPVYIEDSAVKEALERNPVIHKSLEMIKNCDVILTGLGAIDGNGKSRIWEAYVEDDARARIKANGGVGFICAHFFDNQGEFLDLDINDNIIGIKTESIKKNNIIMVAGGKFKAKAILAALKGGYINTIISDDKTLEYVLELANQEAK